MAAGPWDAETLKRVLATQRWMVMRGEAFASDVRAMSSGGKAPDLRSVLRGYLQGRGSFSDPTHAGIRRAANRLATEMGVIADGGSLFEKDWSIGADYVAQYCPDLRPVILAPRQNTELDQVLLLDACPNEARYLALPPPLGNLISRVQRAPFRLYSTDDAVAYVHPFQYQILSKDRKSLWDSGSPRMLSADAIKPARSLALDKNIVIVQDRFDFRNFSHLLCDGLSRIAHYVAQYGATADDLFILGAVPTAYAELLLSTLQAHTGLGPENFLFPNEGMLIETTRKVAWFSDQKEAYIHPAQMAHPISITALRRLCATVEGADSAVRRLYVSRADAARRRIVNEAALIAALEPLGFKTVVLSEHSIREQIGLFRHAEIVVAPHGMGLTHLMMGEKLGRVIELFHPWHGTEAYAFLSRVIGIDYDFVMGTEDANDPTDFSVDIDLVVHLAAAQGAPPRRPVFAKAANHIPASRSFEGFGLHEDGVAPPQSERMIWDQAVFDHQPAASRADLPPQRWRGLAVTADRLYTLSCWVRIPEAFKGARIELVLGGWPNQRRRPADLSLRETWQRISCTARAPDGTLVCWAELRFDGPDGSSISSTCWQFEAGSTPTAYVPTG